MKTVRIYRLKNLPDALFRRIMDGMAESARVWNLCMEMHRSARSERSPWPGKNEFHKATKGVFELYSQSVQQVFRAFAASIASTNKRRADGDETAEYPHKEKYLYPLMWPSQNICVERGSGRVRLVLPMGRGRPSVVLKLRELPDDIGAVRLVWDNGLELHVQTETPSAETSAGREGTRACVDLGEIHLAAVATNEGDALVVSGRGIRAIKRRNNMANAEINRLQSRCKKGSRRWKKLAAARRKLNGRAKRRTRDARHKATRAVVDFCVDKGVNTLFVGNPDGVRKNPKGKKFNQKLSQWEYGKDKQYLKEKAARAAIECFTGSERYTSSTCPACGCRRRPKGRRWECPECGFSGHRDVVGAVNMHAFTFGEKAPFPEDDRITYLRPASDSRRSAGRNAASSSSPDTGRSCLKESSDRKPRGVRTRPQVRLSLSEALPL